MNKIYIVFLIFIGLIFNSCVPTKDLVYLQKKGTSSSAVVSQVGIKPYRIQTNDILNITIKAIDPKLVEIFSSNSQSQGAPSEHSLYFNGYSVDDHGNIRMPILGEINVIGYTTEEIRKTIEDQLLQNYLKKEAGVFVMVKLSGFRYIINGEVGNTGTKVLFQERVNIMEAIANSGDVTVTGDRKNVKVFRKYPQGTEIYTIDLTDSNAVNSPVYYLQNNDYIYVQPLKQKTWGTGKTGIESLSTIITILSLATTTFLLLK
jgi:polysaccharide biosynthesis/export protein